MGNCVDFSMDDHCHRIRVYHADTDAGGIVHHSRYLCYLEQARTESLRQLDIKLPGLLLEFGIQFVVVDLRITYHQPIFVDDAVNIFTKIRQIKKVSLLYDQLVRKADDNDSVVCRATMKLASVGHDRQPKALPKSIIERIYDRFIID